MRELRNLDLNLLKAFDVLMDEKSVSKAAQRLSVTQPAMSGILQRLRDSFNDPLFVRVQRGIVPTNRALEFRQPIKQLLQSAEQLLQPKLFDPQTAELTLTIACTDYALRAVISPFLAVLKQRAPKIKVAILAINEQNLQSQLEQGIVDFGLVTPDFSAPDIHSKDLYQEQYVCALRKDHPVAQQGSISLEQFCRLEQALVSYQGGSFSGATDKALAKLGLTRNVTVSVQNFIVMPEFLTNSDLLAVVPKRLVENLANIHYFEPPLQIDGFTKTLVWHERTHRDPAYRWLRELMAEVC
ncbi:LysR family transcriptional regulator [Basfia succiniciproducens]|uniref:Transcriptional regulator, LysR family n=1 Tax=Basfia succiniciproducens TaxID=653940 RepID=A0A1G5CAQ8_9PAST|nr:LysR family transcriptional regulator [Basfia succiniciproducens]QIM68718.1 transcriptional regulator [Basfia succiniciproducens]SCX99523.1 transcriptional regulator, LysR family [Basfia succiniciproducens]